MKNIVFDLGGVVVDWSLQRVMNEYPGNLELPQLLARGDFFEKHWAEFDRGMMSQVEIVKIMCELSGVNYAECWDFIEYIKHSLVNIPATCDLIQELFEKGYRLFCLSNMSYEYYDYMKDREIFGLFHGQIISAHEKAVKPHPEIFQILIERYNLLPEETLFIDDLEKNIQAARNLGFHTVHFFDREKGLMEIRERLTGDC